MLIIIISVLILGTRNFHLYNNDDFSFYRNDFHTFLTLTLMFSFIVVTSFILFFFGTFVLFV